MVGSYGGCCLAVAGDGVSAGARGPLEARVRLLRHRVLHKVPEVESPQERPLACIFGAHGSGDECRKAGLVLAHITWGAFGGGGGVGGRLGVFIQRVCRLCDAGGAQAVCIVPHEVGPMRGRAAGGVYVNGGGGG